MQVCVWFLGYVVFFWQHLHNSIQNMVGRETLSKPAGGKDPTKNNPTTIKTQLYPQNQHKWHKGHPKNFKFGRSRKLYH